MAKSRGQLYWYHHVADFANIFKGFIGTNYLTLAYAFLQSGLGLGIGGLLLIATLTDHCCQLIIKCKKLVVEDLCNQYCDKHMYLHKENFDMDELQQLKTRLQKNLDYADVGRVVMGKWGARVINFCIMVTQFGFCTGYLVFVGNTIHSLFPVVQTNSSAIINNTVMPNNFQAFMDVQNVYNSFNVNSSFKSRLFKQIDENIYNQSSSIREELPFAKSDVKNNIVVDVLNETMEGNMTTYTAEPIQGLDIVTTVTPIEDTQNASSFLSEMPLTEEITATKKTSAASTISTSEKAQSTQEISPSTDKTTLPTSGSTISPNSPTELPLFHTTEEPNEKNKTIDVITYISTAPPLLALILIQAPLAVIFTLFRSIRHMAPISALASVTTFIGYVAVLTHILINFQVSEDIEWFKWKTLPVFFGQTVAAYEAIGTIIPIEASMDGNQNNFPACLHGGVLLTSFLLGSLGIIGYISYGNDTLQILSLHLPAGHPVTIVVEIMLVIGVLCTYPLQIFPVVEILEGFLFTEGKVCGPKKKYIDEDSDEDDPYSVEDGSQEALLDEGKNLKDFNLTLATEVPKSVPAWKRNIFRSFVALFVCGLALLLRNVFAYIGAFIGAIGSCPLAFIIPCILHFKLTRKKVSACVLVKDVLIVIFGIVAGIISFVVVIQEIVLRI